jgi:hypothetical protein
MGYSMEIFVETRRLLYTNNGYCLEMETHFFANKRKMHGKQSQWQTESI